MSLYPLSRNTFAKIVNIVELKKQNAKKVSSRSVFSSFLLLKRANKRDIEGNNEQ